jgi:transglutaminase-like putative cysteine protease
MSQTAAYPRPEEALGATDVIEAEAPAIRELANRIAGPAEGTEAACLLFEWVRDEIRYDMAPDVEGREDWCATGTLERGQGFCQQKAVLLASVLRARGIPAGVVLQDLLDHKIPPAYVELIGSQRLELHGLTCAFLDGRWVRLDPTLPRAFVEKKRYRLVEFDGENDAVLALTDLDGRPHFEVLEELGTWPDLPDEVVEKVLDLEWLHSDEYKRVARRQGPGM